jgi:hypothetical protein
MPIGYPTAPYFHVGAPIFSQSGRLAVPSSYKKRYKNVSFKTPSSKTIHKEPIQDFDVEISKMAAKFEKGV